MNVDSLLKLARDKSEPGRQSLAGELSNIYLQKSDEMKNKKLSKQEIDLLNQILMQLLSVASSEIRKMLSTELCRVPSMSKDVAIKLAKDEIPIATPMLENSPILEDSDLINIAMEMGKEYQKPIARRENLSEDLANALIDAGDCSVVESVLVNSSSKLSPDSFDAAVDMACEEPQLQIPLVKRKEMTGKAAEKLYFWASQSIRQALVKNFPMKQDAIDRSMDIAIQKLVKAFDPSSQNVTENQKILAKKMAKMGTINSNFLLQFLRLRQHALFRYVLSLYVNLPEDIIDKMIDDTEGKRLSIILKAKGFEKSKFASLFLLARGGRTGEQVVDPHELTHVLAYFSKIPEKEAASILENWQKNPKAFWALVA